MCNFSVRINMVLAKSQRTQRKEIKKKTMHLRLCAFARKENYGQNKNSLG